MKGQHELAIGNFKSFSREHGERKKRMKVNWTVYINKFQAGEITK